MMWLAVGAGAALGAWLRWGLSVWLNPVSSWLPLGTWLANLGGGYLMGLAMGAVLAHPHWSAETRLFIMTGFLGGLTTFSTFSSEVLTHLLKGNWVAATGMILLHVCGSVMLTLLGFWQAQQWWGRA
ncbi:fluoride efflux transporter CrcB [Leeia aquatica]|uniref:Fluoride-specific ion channel FluC n=1 Tax=Leeia aquatica TaxID=2725557 RepID=A0A847S976_9NEIS|nr:fluoride efflux transporter CrcB [Leeia aquatica]NLR75507.1 fluoride efflux transporter CrcB [Leeia aquatica]